MKLSLALGQRQTLSSQMAWACFSINLATPGFGTVAAGRKVGYFQAALTLAGLGFSLFFFVRFIAWYFNHYSNLPFDETDPLAGLRIIWEQVRWPLLGLAVFGVSWLWALVSGLSFVAEAKARERQAKPPAM